MALPAEDEIINIWLVDFLVALKSPIVITESQMSELSQFSTASSSVSGFLEEKVEALSSLPQRAFFFAPHRDGLLEARAQNTINQCVPQSVLYHPGEVDSPGYEIMHGIPQPVANQVASFLRQKKIYVWSCVQTGSLTRSPLFRFQVYNSTRFEIEEFTHHIAK